ncbi:E3 ubiquitin-protein ligase HRD1 [Frankliniella fusca]|uniref:E3 ubiquitin-protein ligase HRD1 n=1 Tax=Frankliniella fusca TaxID=407009 RepID=A0AAE1I1V2_9NEOP|nr:E3 ubiquitin-protein ligase HRD1 [Frankliniella fusca]
MDLWHGEQEGRTVQRVKSTKEDAARLQGRTGAHPAIEPAHEEELTDSALRLQTAPLASRASLNALMPQPSVNASTSVVVNLPAASSYDGAGAELEQQQAGPGPGPGAAGPSAGDQQVRISSL